LATIDSDAKEYHGALLLLSFLLDQGCNPNLSQGGVIDHHGLLCVISAASDFMDKPSDRTSLGLHHCAHLPAVSPTAYR